MRGIDELRGAVQSLPLRIDTVEVQFEQAPVASYPGGRRPSSTVKLHGEGAVGLGEHVGWSVEEHQRFAVAARGIARGTRSVGEWSTTLGPLPPYDRAALEAAAIDLALRQAGTNLFELCGTAPSPVRYVVSFARCIDPLSEAHAAQPAGIELKIDADPDWPDSLWNDLAELGRVAVVDFKLAGRAGDGERVHVDFPDAWIEDAGDAATGASPQLRARLSADAPVTSAAAVETLQPRPAAINVKPARMGGVLEALDCIARCRQLGLATYVGGMFECGIGRRQLLVLAALACPDGPNDIAPLVAQASSPGDRKPPRLQIDSTNPGLAAPA